MVPQTFLFFGRSGCGKGTQAEFLTTYLQKEDPGRRILYVETGSRIRDFMNRVGYSSRMVKDIIEHGGLLPEFLPIWIWTDAFITAYTGNEHLLLDGLSRRVYEAPILDSALQFYKIIRPHLIFINVSRQWAKERLMQRGRADDSEEYIDRRLNWFEVNVAAAIEYFRHNPYYHFIEINGEQSPEEVRRDILAAIRS